MGRGAASPPRSEQRGLFLPLAPEAEKLEITLARIAGIVGERRAGIARLLDTHRKDAFCMERFTATQEKTAAEGTLTMSDAAQNVQLTLRIFRPPHRLHVRTMHGRPTSISPASRQTDQTELHGKILWSAGRWRSSGEWPAAAAQQENGLLPAVPGTTRNGTSHLRMVAVEGLVFIAFTGMPPTDIGLPMRVTTEEACVVSRTFREQL